ncbi:MAG: extracellular solute-binding protein [Patescibacteria group bacterium]
MQTSNFQIIVLGVCVALILAGIAVFASFGGLLGGSGIGKVVVWGTLDSDVMQNLLDNLRSEDKTFQTVSYIEKDPATYNEELVNAMANGTAPDLFMLADEDLVSFADKILPIPYSVVSQSSYLGSYIDEGQLFLTSDGALALPFLVDPLVMYWNRDLFAAAGLATAPKYWNDFLTLSPKITSLDASSNLKKSAVALGEWRNIDHAKETLSTLLMQAGDQIAVRGEEGAPVIVFGNSPANFPERPAESVVRFYTEFANPSKTSYSWNRALPKASSVFTSGDLAVYFGFASEYLNIADLNPNLRFSVSLMPQIEGNSTRVTYGHITGLSIPRVANNPQGAVAIAQKLTGQFTSAYLSKALILPSVRRDVPADTKANAAADIFLQSALIARSWLDPSPVETDAIFKTMIESVVSGKAQPPGAVGDAAQELNRLVR